MIEFLSSPFMLSSYCYKLTIMFKFKVLNLLSFCKQSIDKSLIMAQISHLNFVFLFD